MSTDIVAALKNSIAVVPTGVDADTAAVAGSSGQKRISIKGGVFRKMVGGKEVGTVEDRHMNVVFVKLSHTPSRTFYTGAYQEGLKVAPVCWSSDSKTPDADVRDPVAPSCDKCPNSVKGSGKEGLSSACRLSWRTAVVLPNDPAGDVMQLVLPATSVFGKEDAARWPFRAYVQMLAGHNISAGRVITRMAFDTKAPVPKVLFSPVGPVNEADLAVLQSQAQSPAAENAVKLTVYHMDEGMAVPRAAVLTSVEGSVDGVKDVEPPVVRAKTSANAEDVSDIVKKWSKKK